MLLRPDELANEEKPVVELLRRLSSEVGRAQELTLNFVGLVKEWGLSLQHQKRGRTGSEQSYRTYKSRRRRSAS
jgi:hypothetical protein